MKKKSDTLSGKHIKMEIRMDELKKRRILFSLVIQCHAYLMSGLWISCCASLHRASQNNAFVHRTSLQSLICFVISAELQPTRLQLGSHSSSSSSLHTKTRRKQWATRCNNKGSSCWSSLLEVFRVWGGRQDLRKELTASCFNRQTLTYSETSSCRVTSRDTA